MKICLTTSFTKDYGRIGDLCLRSIQRYAGRYGYHIKSYGKLPGKRHIVWDRISITQALFREGYDFVFWIDSDTVFLRFDKDISSEIEEGKDLYLVERPSRGGKHLNFGIFLIRNSPWSKKLLNDIWKMERYLNHCWQEQGALIDLLGLIGDLGDDHRKNLGFGSQWGEPNLELLRKVKKLDLKWNSFPGKAESNNPIINHYPSFSLPIRYRKMLRDSYRAQTISRWVFIKDTLISYPSLIIYYIITAVIFIYSRVHFLRIFKVFLQRYQPGLFLRLKRLIKRYPPGR